MRKIAIILGTRPEAIKLVPVILELSSRSEIQCHVCVTGQHREMLDQVLKVFRVKPDTDLQLMRPRQTLAELSARAIKALDKFLAAQRPNLVLVQGDTTTAFCASLTAFYHRIPVAHVEAGLRTWNLEAPWPEEANRVLISRLAALHFCPTEENRRNLLQEGVQRSRILVTGNTGIDALFLARDRARSMWPRLEGVPKGLLDSTHGERKLVLITGHRRENFGSGFENICNAIGKLARRFPKVDFLYPVHLNPNVCEPVFRILGNHKPGGRSGIGSPPSNASPLPNLHLIKPVPYLSFVALMDRATVILTDSGGVQEEGPTLGKPVLVMRETTERPEALASGNVRLVGTSEKRIMSEVARLLQDPLAHASMSKPSRLYGDGKAAKRIAKAVNDLLFASGRTHRKIRVKVRR